MLAAGAGKDGSTIHLRHMSTFAHRYYRMNTLAAPRPQDDLLLFRMNKVHEHVLRTNMTFQIRLDCSVGSPVSVLRFYTQ